MNLNCVGKDAEKKLVARLNAYAFKGAPLKVIAAQCDVNWGLFQQFIAGTSRSRMTEHTYRKVKRWLDEHDEYMPDSYQRCTKCGEVKLVSEFYHDARNPNGRKMHCKTCSVSTRKKKEEEKTMANNNTTNIITVDLVKRVKAEDNKAVAAAMLAPYFKITPAQLEDIRAGKWDSLLYKKEEPKPATDVKNAVEALRKEVAEMHSAINRIMAELGCADENKEEK